MQTRTKVMFALPFAGLLFGLAAAAAPGHKGQEASDWSTQEMPLPLAVKTADDLRIKALAERHYLIFNLIGHGKVAWDSGDFATAAARWEELLKVPGLDSATESVFRPLAKAARAKAGGAAVEAPTLPDTGTPEVTPEKPVEAPKPKPQATVTGTVSGGENGPGGAVVVLKPLNGKVDVRPAKGKVMLQKDKQFIPHVLAVPMGSNVSFKNIDPLFHNAFSLSPTRKFDTDLYGKDEERSYVFDKPGVVEVLCNIHSSMLGYVVVVDSPWYSTVGASGTFSIKGVPPGTYEVELWHESMTNPVKSRVTVTDEGARLSLNVASDRKAAQFPPDKYGKPRQSQLGY